MGRGGAGCPDPPREGDRMCRGKRAFLLGMRDGAPFNLVVVPFGLLFGVAASNAGWSVLQIGAMSVFVIAGARNSPPCS